MVEITASRAAAASALVSDVFAARCLQRSDRFTIAPPRAVDGRCSTMPAGLSSMSRNDRRPGDVPENGALRSGHGEDRDRQGQAPPGAIRTAPTDGRGRPGSFAAIHDAHRAGRDGGLSQRVA